MSELRDLFDKFRLLDEPANLGIHKFRIPQNYSYGIRVAKNVTELH